MKPFSIRRRLMLGVAVVQISAATVSTVLVVRHEHRQAYAVLDANLSEHAALVQAAIEPPDEGNQGLSLRKELLGPMHSDRYVLSDVAGHVVAEHGYWFPDHPLPAGPRTFFNFDIEGRAYRGLVLRDMAINVEPNEVNNLPPLVLVYATRTHRADEQILHIALMTIGTCLLLLLASLLATAWVVGAGLRPVMMLVGRAARIDATNWEFAESGAGTEPQELAPLSAALTHLVGRLRASFERERRFAADAAHEMKTAVAIVKSTLQLTLDREREAVEYRRGMERALEDTDRLQRLVGDMLHLAKIEGSGSDAIPGEASTADVVHVAHDVVRRMDPLLTARQIRVVVQQRGEGATVRMVPDELRVVLTNLLENAVYACTDGASADAASGGVASKDHSEIRVTAEIEAQESVLSVADAGCGISAEALPHVFERFFRGDPSRSRESGGNGLGLSIVQAMVERAGGSITVSSEPGVGSVFVVRLPLVKPEQPDGMAN